MSLKSFLPEKGSPKAEQFLEVYRKSTREQRKKWAQEYGFKNFTTLQCCVRDRLGENVPPRKLIPVLLAEEIEKPIIVELPPIKLRDYKPKKVKRGDEEEVVFQAGDGHAGKITVSFDPDIFFARMDTAFDSIMTIVSLHRNMYPINKLRIVDLGDNVQGEQAAQGSKIGSVAMGVRDQIAKLALPAWVKLICSLKQEFAVVEFDGFPGNHGYERLAPETSRADLSFYDLLRAKLNDKKGITINIHETSGEIIEIMGFRFYCFHGDEVSGVQGVPHFALRRKLNAWHMQYGGFHYALGAHHHCRIIDEISSVLTYSRCSTLVSDDDWALKKLGVSSTPSQTLFGMHPSFGMTWNYPLVVDYKFSPQKKEEK